MLCCWQCSCRRWRSVLAVSSMRDTQYTLHKSHVTLAVCVCVCACRCVCVSVCVSRYTGFLFVCGDVCVVPCVGVFFLLCVCVGMGAKGKKNPDLISCV